MWFHVWSNNVRRLGLRLRPRERASLTRKGPRRAKAAGAQAVLTSLVRRLPTGAAPWAARGAANAAACAAMASLFPHDQQLAFANAQQARARCAAAASPPRAADARSAAARASAAAFQHAAAAQQRCVPAPRLARCAAPRRAVRLLVLR